MNFARDLVDAADPCLITFTSGTSGEPKAVVHAQRYLFGQRVQAEHWLDARADELVWCTAASGWSKSARNAFIAPWIRGAAALLHDARFDPHERLALLEEEPVAVLCMAPTEYRVLAKRAEPRGTQDGHGFLFFEGRTDDVIISAGYRIGPFEVESALVEHPAVAEAAVVAAPDTIRGEIVKAFVILAPGHQASEQLGLDLQEHVKRVTAPYKYPREIEFTAELPKTISGKIRRVELRQRERERKAAGQPKE